MGVAAVLDSRTSAAGEGESAQFSQPAVPCLVIHRRPGASIGLGGTSGPRPPCAACSVCVDAGMDVRCISTYMYRYHITVSCYDQLLGLVLDQFCSFVPM